MVTVTLDCLAQGQESSTTTPATSGSLLWRVTSTRDTITSYLYGTMHTQDVRAFRFADSVLPALSRARCFAMEQRLDTLMDVLLDQLTDTSRGLRLADVVTKEQCDSLSPLLAQRLNLPPSIIPRVRVAMLGDLFRMEGPATKKKRTFVDAFLFGVARSLGKPAVGLEPLGSSLAILDAFGAAEIREKLTMSAFNQRMQALKSERMIKYYDTGQLDSLMAIMSREMTPGLLDTVLWQRNVVMAQSIDSLTRHGGVFAAMGAAHLSGERGLITLLRRMGYTVTPVLPSYIATSSLLDTLKMSGFEQWSEYVSERNAFTVRLPAKLAESRLYRQVYNNMEMDLPQCSELVSGLQFVVFAMRTPTIISNEEMRLRSRTMVRPVLRLLDQEDSVHVDSLGYKNYPTFEYTSSAVNPNTDAPRIRVVFRRNILYELVVTGPLSSLSLPLVDTFFHSLQFLEAPTAEWKDYHDTLAGMTLAFPGTVLRLPQDYAGTDPHIRYASDPQTSSTFLSTWWDQRRTPSQKSVVAYMRHLLQPSWFVYFNTTNKKKVEVDSSSSEELRVSHRSVDSNNVTSIEHVVARGRRFYNFRMQYSDASTYQRDSARFFSSIRFTPPTISEAVSRVECDSIGVSLTAWSTPTSTDNYEKPDYSDFDTSQVYELNDEMGFRYADVARHQRNIYSSDSHPDTLVVRLLAAYVHESDTVVQHETGILYGLPTHSYLMRSKESFETGYWYQWLFTYVAEPFAYCVLMPVMHDNGDHGAARAHALFSSLRCRDSIPSPITTDPRQLWLEDMLCSDTVRNVKAAKYLSSNATLDSSWFSVLREAILKPAYADDSLLTKNDHSTYVRCTRKSILQRLARDTTREGIAALVRVATDTTFSSCIHAEALLILAHLQTDSCLAGVLSVLEKEATRERCSEFDYNDILESLPVSADVTRLYGSRIASLYNVRAYRGGVLALLSSIVDSTHDAATLTRLLPSPVVCTKDFAVAAKDYERSLRYPMRVRRDPRDENSGMRDVSDRESRSIVSSFCELYHVVTPTPDVVKTLNRIVREIRTQDDALACQALEALIYSKMSIDSLALLAAVDSCHTSERILFALDSAGRRELVDAHYFNQEWIAYCAALNYLTQRDEDDESADPEESMQEQPNYTVTRVYSKVLDSDSSNIPPGRYFVFRAQAGPTHGDTSKTKQFSDRDRTFVVGPYNSDPKILFDNKAEIHYPLGVKDDDSYDAILLKAIDSREQSKYFNTGSD